MNESLFKNKLKDSTLKLCNGVIWQNHSDRFSTGIPDSEVVWNGITTWIEVKYWGKKLPKSYEAKVQLVSPDMIHPLQKEFLEKRNRAGINGIVVIGLSGEGATNGCQLAVVIEGIEIPKQLTKRQLYQKVNLHQVNGVWDLRPWLK